ncbi:DNA circularization protein [Chitiniphilus shinanonensis]|uniref:DNA circularization protein n=1 Tax=Chitiniphilus shinanonensis TaxID=553088 RepID=UPI0030373579
MSWRDQLEKASFRGVQFHVSRSGGEVGRRVQLTEYPLRDRPYAEDLGRKARTFTLDAFVLGPDYRAVRDRLLAALEQPGVGELVLPSRGHQQVVAQRCSLEETAEQGGMARLSLEFAEAGANELPNSQIDTEAQLLQAGDRLIAACGQDFAAQWKVGAQWLEGDLLTALEAGVGDFLEALAAVQQTFDWIERQLGTVERIAQQVDEVLNSLEKLLGTPAALYQRLVGSLERIGIRLQRFGQDFDSIVTGRRPNGGTQALDSMKPLLFESPARQAMLPSTPVNVANLRNRLALDQATRTIAVAQAAMALPRAPVLASADLIAMRDTVFDAIDALADQASDLTYPALLALKAATVRAVAERLPATAQLREVWQSVREPALVVAWRQNGNLDAELDLVVRNDIRHPGFVPDGRTLNLLKT